MLHGQVGRIEAFYDLSPLVAFKASPPLPPYLCATLMHTCVHIHTDTHKRSLKRSLKKGDSGVCQVLHSSQLNSRCSETISILMQGLFSPWY